MKDIKIFLKKEKKKNNNMAVNVTKIYQKMNSKSILSIEEILQNLKKIHNYNYMKTFQPKKYFLFIKKVISKNVKRNIRNFRFSGFSNSLLKYKEFFMR